MKNLTSNNVSNMLTETSKLIIMNHPKATYSVSSTNDNMLQFARMIVKVNGLTRNEHFGDLLDYRVAFEKSITKKHRVKFTYKMGEDLAVKYRKKRVPQLTQVKSGLLDILIGELNTTYINMNGIA